MTPARPAGRRTPPARDCASEAPLPRADLAPRRARREPPGLVGRHALPLLASAGLHGVALLALLVLFAPLRGPVQGDGAVLAVVYVDAPPDALDPELVDPSRLEVPEWEEVLVEPEPEEAERLDEHDLLPAPEETLPPLDEATPSAFQEHPPLTAAVVRRPPAPTPAVRPPTPPTPPPSARPPPTPPPASPPPRAARGGTLRGRLVPLASPRHYPEAARALGIQGLVKVEVWVDADGRVHDPRLVVSSGSDLLDQAALASARGWRFAPPGEVRRVLLPFRYTIP